MESVKVAIDYVVDKIINPCMDRKDDSICVYFAKVNRKGITKEQLKYFKEVLETGMTDEIEQFGSSELKTEYLPVGLLYDSLLVTDMPLDACPLDMDIKVDKYSTKVKLGKGKPFVNVYEQKEKCMRKRLV